jgi:hypothetical protein
MMNNKRFLLHCLVGVNLLLVLISRPTPIFAADLPALKHDPNTGKIYDANNREMNLFGVNYYGGMYQYINIYANYDVLLSQPPSTRPLFNDIGFTNASTRRQDVKIKVIDRDLDDLTRMGAEVIRIHIMMGDIADSSGGLRAGSDELDWFDYLIAGAISRGMYVYLTPIVAWDWYITLPGRFSDFAWNNADYTSNTTTLNRAKAFIYNLMVHNNPYLNGGAGRPYAKEPGIGLIELLNEPVYRRDSSGNYNAVPYSYGFLKDTLINGMLQRVRDAQAATGSAIQHLVGWSLWGVDRTLDVTKTGGVGGCGGDTIYPANPNVDEAIRDSNVQFYAVSGYTEFWWCNYPFYGGSNGGPSSESFVNAAAAGNYPSGNFYPSGNYRAKVVYEWDAQSVQKTYIYPNIAANMRKAGNQIAASFEYDMFVEGHKNSVWPNHYLNYYYSPQRAASWMIARATFKDQPVGGAYSDNSGGTNTLAAYTKTSFPNNISVYHDGRKLMHTATIPSSMTPTLTWALQEVIGVGNSPVATFTGSGLYRLWREITATKNSVILEVNPDVHVNNRTYTVGGTGYSSTIYFDPTCYCFANPNTLSDTRVLQQNTRSFTLNWPGLTAFSVYRVNADGSETFITNATNTTAFSVQTGIVTAGSPRSAKSIYYKLYPTTITYPTGVNIALNGTFASGSDNGWYHTWGGTTYSNAAIQTQSGQGPYLVLWSGSAYSQYTYQAVKNIPNGTYQLSAKVVAASGLTSLYLGAQHFNSSGTSQSLSLPTTGIANWTTYTVPNINVQNNQIEIYVYTDNPAGGKWVAIDDVVLTRTSTGGTYAASGSPGAEPSVVPPKRAPTFVPPGR